MFFFDYTYVLVLIGALLCALASWNVSATFRKYNKIKNEKGITAQDAAEIILRNAGIHDVSISSVQGNLTDHYSATSNELRLSNSVYGFSSVAAVGIAAHECGHAIQQHDGYWPHKLRMISVPAATFFSL